MLKETGTEKVYYACQSMGCGAYLSALAEMPELNNKFKAGFLMAPFGYYGSSYNPVFAMLRPILGTRLEHMVFWLVGGKLGGEPGFLAKTLGLTLDNLCTWPFLRCGICDNLLFAIYGADPEQMNYSDLPNILRKLQDNLALKTLLHGVQSDVSCDFRKYDFGPMKNLEKYGNSEPPRIDLSKTSVPTYIFYGESDNFVTPSNVRRTANAIPQKYVKGVYQVDWPLFNHVDFLMAKDADILVYHKIRDIINKLESETN